MLYPCPIAYFQPDIAHLYSYSYAEYPRTIHWVVLTSTGKKLKNPNNAHCSWLLCVNRKIYHIILLFLHSSFETWVFLYIFYIILTIWAWNGMVQHDIQNKIESAREMNVKGLFYTMTKPFSVFHQHIHIHMNWLIHYFSFWFLFPFPFCCLFQWSQSERHYCNFFCSLSMILLLFYKIWGFVLGFNSGSFFVW